MKQSWTKGLKPDAAKEMRMAFKSSLIFRNRLAELIRIKEEENIRAGRSKDGYECPNWAYKQADLVGYTRALNDIISLIEK